MLKQVSKTFVPLVALLLYLPLSVLYGQQSAMSSFEQGDYRAALSAFRALEDQDGNDKGYGYYIGRCLVALNEELDEAIELLYQASRSNIQTDALFYLGRAYHLHYNFHDARRCYEAYDRIASKQERKAHRVKHLIETCSSASEITASYNPYEVINVTFIDLSDSLQYTQVKMKGGDLGRKADMYFNEDEDRGGLTALMFHPGDAVRGDYMYFSGYARNKKDGSQLYRVRKGAGNAWGDPQELSSLNSAGNEILPYFDPIENDLYFASDGKAGVGGYDLYRSHYDEERDQWTEAVNLGFPVNSVSDEYLLLPGTDLGMVLFFSNRQGTDSTVAVYRIHLVEPKKKTALNDDQQLREIASLGGMAEEMLAASAALQAPGIDAAEQQAALEESTLRREEKTLPAYQETLALALRHQVVSDSLKDLAASARIVVRESDDPNDRWVWQKQIMVWEKKAHDEEQLADQLYAQMDLERARHAESQAVNTPETIEVDRQIGDLTVYRYTGMGPGPEVSEKEQAEALSATASEKTWQFEVLAQSPYSASNPIPMDETLPRGTFYRIQLGAFGMEVNPDAFGGISPLTGDKMPERGLIKYYAGKFKRYEDASTALPRLHSLGYEDAFIVAWYNGIQVSTQKAKQLE